jgi:hypothetical protein
MLIFLDVSHLSNNYDVDKRLIFNYKIPLCLEFVALQKIGLQMVIIKSK